MQHISLLLLRLVCPSVGAPSATETMAAFKRLESNLQAVQKLLSQLEGQPCFEEVAKTQANNFEKLLGTSPAVEAEQAASLNDLVLASTFPNDIKSRLVARISNGSCSTVAGASSRVKQQDFQTIFEYLPVDLWHTLASSSVAESAKLELLVDMCLKLGARNPSEDTFAMVTALHQLSVHGPDKLAALTWQARLESNQQTKRVFRRNAKCLMPPFAVLEALPTKPAAFQSSYPDEFAKIYGAKVPVVCPLGEACVRHAQDLIPRRNTRRGVASEQHQQGQLQLGRASDLGSLLQSVLQPLVQPLMQQLVQVGSGSALQSNPLQITMLPPAQGARALPAPIQAGGPSSESEQPEGQGHGEERAATNKGEATKSELPPAANAKTVAKLAVETCTDRILAGLKDRDSEKTKSKANKKGKKGKKAKGKSKGKGKSKVLPTIAKPKGESKAKKAAMPQQKNSGSPKGHEAKTKVLPTIAKPKPSEPVHFGQCTIMHGQGKWRVTTATNRRFDKAFSFKKAGSWDDLVGYCMANQ